MDKHLPPLEKLESLFKKFKGGDLESGDKLFEIIWINFTRLAHQKEAQPTLKKIYDWTDQHRAKYPKFYAFAKLSSGFIAFLRDDYEQAFKVLNHSIELFSEINDQNGIAAAKISLGFVHRSKGEIDIALKFGLPAMEQLAASGEYKMFQIIGNLWIGGIYSENGHLEEALHLFQQALEINYPAGIEALGARFLNGIGGVYMQKKNYPLALHNYRKALEMCNDLTEETFKARGITDLGEYYFQTNNYPLAIKYNLEALAMRREIKFLNGSITNLINLGKIYFKQEKLNKAIEVLLEALDLAEEIKMKVKMYQIHQLLSDIYYAKNNIAESLKHFKAFHEIKEAVYFDDLERKVSNQVQLFQAEQTEKENALIKAQKIEIEKEKKRSDDLLLNILPEELAEELKEKGKADAKQFDAVSVLFTDFKDFTQISEKMTPTELVEELNIFFIAFDEIITKLGIEKIKTIGDSYMCAAGLPTASPSHAEDTVRAGLEIQQFVEKHSTERVAMGKEPLLIRIGIHSGPVIAGIVGIKKFAYDIWGDTVNTASRMESSGEPGKVNISGSTYDLIKHKFKCTPRGKVVAKHKGEMEMYFVEGAL